MVVGRRDRHRLADAQIGQHPRVRGLEARRHAQRADPDDDALARHEAGNGLDRADRPRVGQGDRRAGEVVGGDLVGVDLADQVLIGGDEALEVPGVGIGDAGDEQGPPTGLLDVDGQTQPDVLVTDHPGSALAVGVGHEGGVHGRDGGEGPDHRVADEVGETDLAARGAPELVVDHRAVDLEQLGRHDAHAGGRGNPEGRLHVGDDPGGRTSQRCGAGHRGRCRGDGRGGSGWCGDRSRRRCRCRHRCRCRWRRRCRCRRRPVVVEELLPRGRHRRRVGQIALVHVLDQPGVGPEGARPGGRAPLSVLCLHRRVSTLGAVHVSRAYREAAGVGMPDRRPRPVD